MNPERKALEDLFKGIKGLEFYTGCDENYEVSTNGVSIAIVHDLPQNVLPNEIGGLSAVVHSAKVFKEDLRKYNLPWRERLSAGLTYQKVVRRLEEKGYSISYEENPGPHDLRITT